MARLVCIYPSGGTPANPVEGSWDATYTTMALMEAGEDGESGTHHIECRIVDTPTHHWDGNPDTSCVVFDGWNTAYASSRYLQVTTEGAARPSANGFWDTTAYILQCSDADQLLDIDNDFAGGTFSAVFDGIQFQKITNAESVVLFHSGSDHDFVRFSKCWFQQDTASFNVYMMNNATTEHQLVNCVINGGVHGIKMLGGAGEPTYLVNCTVQGVTDDGLESDEGDLYVYNTALFYNLDDLVDTILGSHNATDEGAGEGTNGIDLTPTAGPDRDGDLHDIFEDPNGNDYRLTGSTTIADIIGKGIASGSQSRVPSDDIVGSARSDPPDIGAFEYVAAGGGIAPTGVIYGPLVGPMGGPI